MSCFAAASTASRSAAFWFQKIGMIISSYATLQGSKRAD
jgi:hypothetical protein